MGKSISSRRIALNIVLTVLRGESSDHFEEGTVIRSTTAIALGLLLAALPVSIDDVEQGSFTGSQAFAAAGGNGKSNAGGNNKGNGAANGNAASAASGGPETGKSKGKDKSQLAKSDPLHPSNLGRLNSLKSENSKAARIIGEVYAGQLSEYLGTLAALNATPDTTLDALAAVQLSALANTLAKVANKPLSPEIIAYVNAYVAAQNPDNPALASLAGPTADELASTDPAIAAAAQAAAAANAALVSDILAAGGAADSELTNNGLGQIY
jgi:hypothetical protein